MRKIKVDIDLYNDTEIMNELDHIAILVQNGQTSGQGWSIEGEVEKELIVKEEEDENELTDNI